MNLYERARSSLRDMAADEKLRFWVQFLWVNRVLALVSFGMSVVNIFTKEYLLMLSTLIFCVMCLINVVFARRRRPGQKFVGILFMAEFLALLMFFLISGIPDGFSVLWCILIPPYSLAMYGRKRGTLMSAVLFVMIASVYWTPLGGVVLQYSYNTTFQLRFPMLYAAVYTMSFFIETIRAMTQEELMEAREKYRYLYAHDSLTGAYNRYGFDKRIRSVLKNADKYGAALIIMDIDHFKNINDHYGHTQGDTVLKEVTALLEAASGEHGYVCRWGGEEFAVLLKKDSNAQELAEMMREKIADTRIRLDRFVVGITASFGVAVADGQVEVTELVSCADNCLYSAKQHGRNRVVVKTIHVTAEKHEEKNGGKQ